LYGDHNSTIYYETWEKAAGRNKCALDWIYDFNKIRDVFITKLEDPELETLSTVMT